MRVTTRRIGLLIAGAVMALAACERADNRLEQLTVGIGKDSVLAVMGTKPDRLDPFLNKGQYIEAMYFTRQGVADSTARTDRKMSPVVVINGKLVGWGWTYWDSVAGANNIPVAPPGK